MAAADGTVRANKDHQTCRGNGDGKQAKLTSSNTGSPSGDGRRDQPATRESQAGPCGVAERSVVPKKPVTLVEEGALVKDGRKKQRRTWGLTMSPATPELCSEAADGVTRNIVCLFREPDAGNPPVRFDEREQETEPCQTGLRRRRESFVSSHRETTVTAPILSLLGIGQCNDHELEATPS